MNLLHKDHDKTESPENLGNAIAGMIEKLMGMKGWGFHKSYIDFTKWGSQKVIYDSEWCRINFIFSRERLPEYDELSIHYGRLHAHNENPYMDWDGQQCRCWHKYTGALRFLDGLSPSEAMEQVKVYKQLPAVMECYRKSEIGQELLAAYPPKYAIVQQSIIWEHYGTRLFELFDLRRPDLWEEYRKFIKEYHRLMGTKTYYGPPEENIC